MQLKWIFTVWAVVSYTEAQSIDNRNSPIGDRPSDRPIQTSEAEVDSILSNAFPDSEVVKGYPSIGGDSGSVQPSVPSNNDITSRPVQQPGAFSNNISLPNCACVPSNQCTPGGTVDLYAGGQIDPRIVPVCSADQVCCRPTSIPQTPETTATPSIPGVNSCGRQNISDVRINDRIVNIEDSETRFGEFPWMAAVFQSVVKPDGTSALVYLCGGSLIHPQVVMTAAHSIWGKRDLGVKLGEWDTKRDSEPIPSQSRDVREIIMHEEYTSGVLFNDIALLILSEPVSMEQSVAPICLPEQGESMDNRDCLSSGWGKDAFDKPGRYQALLKKVELPTVSRDTCEDALRRKTRLGGRFILHPSFICAGGELGRDTCKGDGGSPLVCPSRSNSEVYVQAGIVSWGIECGKDIPAAYTNVAQFRNWIDNKLSVFSIDTKRGI